LPSFDKKFNHQFLIGSEKTRLRKFDLKSFFISVLHLVQGKNNEGYFHALAWTWDILSDLTQAPVKSAFAKIRQRVSFKFFKTHFDELIESYQSSHLTWRGLRVYAIDGDMYELPRTKDILENGYEGRACRYGMETHYPFLYVNHCYDVLSGITKAFDYSPKHEEFHSAQRIARKLERESVTLYDRYFFCKNLVRAHRESQSYFVARIKKGGVGTLLAMREFGRGKERARTFDFEGVRVRLLRIKNPRTGSELLLATNLPCLGSICSQGARRPLRSSLGCGDCPPGLESYDEDGSVALEAPQWNFTGAICVLMADESGQNTNASRTGAQPKTARYVLLC